MDKTELTEVREFLDSHMPFIDVRMTTGEVTKLITAVVAANVVTVAVLMNVKPAWKQARGFWKTIHPIVVKTEE